MWFECHHIAVLMTFHRFLMLVLKIQQVSSSLGELNMSSRFEKCSSRDSDPRLGLALEQHFSDFKQSDSGGWGGA